MHGLWQRGRGSESWSHAQLLRSAHETDEGEHHGCGKREACARYRTDRGRLRVKVGSVEHPMLPEHYIQWIELLTPTDVLRHELQPGEKPEVIFLTDAKEVSAREYCNLHGLWKGDANTSPHDEHH